jgi:hypothetical protein
MRPKDPIEKVEVEYQNKPRIFIIGFFVLATLFLIIQSFFAQPRAITSLVFDSWELIISSILLIYVFWKREVKNLLLIGLVFFVISVLMAFNFISFIRPGYGVLFFSVAIWLIFDWVNVKRFKKGIFTELLRGNYYLAGGIILSALVLGSVIELSNIPFQLWEYHWPIPSLELGGVPIIYVVLGWLPWLMAIFVLFYPLAIKRPKKFNKK